MHISMEMYYYYCWTDASSSFYSNRAPFMEMHDYIVHI